VADRSMQPCRVKLKFALKNNPQGVLSFINTVKLRLVLYVL